MIFQKLLKKLNEELSEQAIASAIGERQPLIHKLKTGAQVEPSFSKGVKIVNFAQQNGIFVDGLQIIVSDKDHTPPEN